MDALLSAPTLSDLVRHSPVMQQAILDTLDTAIHRRQVDLAQLIDITGRLDSVLGQ